MLDGRNFIFLLARSQLLLFTLLVSNTTLSDSFVNNIFNNHGTVGLINTPTARFYNEAVHGVTVYNGTKDQKVTLTSNPYDWLEASFFYSSVRGVPYPSFEWQDYKDKGFNIKLRIKKEGLFPAIAVGMYDFAGTGLYSSEYVVGSYGIKNIDMHFGLGWGRLNQKGDGFKNPLIYVYDGFGNRPEGFSGPGGQFENTKYFSGKKTSPFYGITYKRNENILFKFERDTIDEDNRSGPLIFDRRSSKFSFGMDYIFNENFSMGLSFERGNFFSWKFVYKNNPKKTLKKYNYQKAKEDPKDGKYTKLIKNLEKNGIGVNKISEGSKSIGIELTQFIHPDIKLVEEIIFKASKDAGINKEIKKDIRIADLKAISEIDQTFIKNSELIYQRQTKRRFNTTTGIRFRPFIAGREEFFKGAILAENNSEFILKDNLFFNANFKYTLAHNFDNLRFPPVDTFPAQVRSDVKKYLKNMDKGVLIGRAQFDYHITPKQHHHFMASAGILEDMFSGYGIEYLYFKEQSNYAYGFEVFDVQKRDYDWGFGHLDYKNTIYNGNFYYRNYGYIPFDLKISAGEYLAGDKGATFELSRTFRSGVQFGVFATFTDVSPEDFGEGSFDKGIYFNIPIYGNLINYTWKPLTKDPGATLTRRNSLYDLLVRFRPID